MATIGLQDLTGMDRFQTSHGLTPSVVIDNLRIVSVSKLEAETEPPLVVDPDAVPARTVTPERLQTVPRRDPQEIQCRSCVQLGQLPLRDSLSLITGFRVAGRFRPARTLRVSHADHAPQKADALESSRFRLGSGGRL